MAFATAANNGINTFSQVREQNAWRHPTPFDFYFGLYMARERKERDILKQIL